MKHLRLFAAAMAVAVAFGLSSCGSDPDAPYDGFTMTTENAIEAETLEHSPDASYPVHFSVTWDGGNLVVTPLISKPVEGSPLGNRDCETAVRIGTVERVSGLDKIDEVDDIEGSWDPSWSTANDPAPASVAVTIPATAKYGYIIEARGVSNVNAYGNPAVKDPTSMYMRLWVEEIVEGALHVRYEYPFTPKDAK